MDPLREWHRRVDRLSRPARRVHGDGGPAAAPDEERSGPAASAAGSRWTGGARPAVPPPLRADEAAARGAGAGGTPPPPRPAPETARPTLPWARQPRPEERPAPGGPGTSAAPGSGPAARAAPLAPVRTAAPSAPPAAEEPEPLLRRVPEAALPDLQPPPFDLDFPIFRQPVPPRAESPPSLPARAQDPPLPPPAPFSGPAENEPAPEEAEEDEESGLLLAEAGAKGGAAPAIAAESAPAPPSPGGTPPPLRIPEARGGESRGAEASVPPSPAPTAVPDGGSAPELPAFWQVLSRIQGQDVAQNSYKYPFRETREELIRRLLDPPLTLEETARILGVCPTTVRRYTNRGVLRHFRTQGNQRRFRLSDVLEFLESRAAEIEADARRDSAAGPGDDS